MMVGTAQDCLGSNTSVVVAREIEAIPRVPGNVDESLKTVPKQTVLAGAVTEGEESQLLAIS